MLPLLETVYRLERALTLASSSLLCYAEFGYENGQKTQIHTFIGTCLLLCTHPQTWKVVLAQQHLHFSCVFLHNVMHIYHACCWDGAHTQ